jgi:hypothetical protein
MAAKPLVPNIQKSTHQSHLPPGRLIDNPAAKTVAQALANSKRLVDATK